MRHTAYVCIAILMTVVTGCHPANTPMPDFTLSAILQGDWQVETLDMSENQTTTLGTLTINGNRYHFHKAFGVEVPSWMRDRFCFFTHPYGEIVFHYESGVSPDDDVRTFENYDILLTCSGIGCRESFLIRVDQDNQELYFHAWFSEIQLYHIHKSYDR